MNASTCKRAAAYLRVSTDEQVRDGLSLEMQLARIRAYAESQGWELSNVFEDDGYSGTKLDRPAMMRLIETAAVGGFQILLVYRVDRLTRRHRDLWYLLEDVFEKHSVGFKSVTEPFDTTTAQGKAFLGMLAVFAQLERDTIAERTKDALRHRKAGGGLCGRAPFGYAYSENHQLVRDPQKQPIVTRIKRLRREGKTFREISGRLGVPLGTVFSVAKADQRSINSKCERQL